MNTIAGVYKITNLINNKCYIGRSINIESRWKEHYRLNKNYLIYKAFNKYGIENFSFEIIELIERDNMKKLNTELNNREKYYIKKYKTDNKKFGYNLTKGGSGVIGFHHSSETKKRLSQNHISNKNWNYGNHRPIEVKERIAKNHIGIKLSKEHKEAISKGNIGKHNKIFSNEHKLNISKAKKGEKNPNYGKKGKDSCRSIKVICLNSFLVFESIGLASEYYKIKDSHICESCKDLKKSAGKDTDGNKLHWMYYNDYLDISCVE